MLTVLSYNIHRGLDWLGRQTDPHALVASVLGFAPDICFLQEVPIENGFSSDEKNTQTALFKAFFEAGLEYHYYGKCITQQWGTQGNAIFSRFPLSPQSQYLLTCKSRNAEPRYLLHAKVDVPEYGLVDCFTTHLGLNFSTRSEELSELLTTLEDLSLAQSPIVLAGDFNDWTTQLHGRLTEAGNLEDAYKMKTGCFAKTFPSFLPVFPLDRLYVRNWVVDEVFRFKPREWRTFSDHLPVGVQLSIPSTLQPLS